MAKLPMQPSRIFDGQQTCLVIAPHPDDETIGAGIWMRRIGAEHLTILHITDGSPRNLSFARAAGFRSRDAYSRARTKEVTSALSRLSIRRDQIVRFHFVDQEVYFHLPWLIVRLSALIKRLHPSIVLSPAYEGGHPDHDSVALATAAVRQIAPVRFTHYEYSLYHADAKGRMVTGTFIPAKSSRARVISLSASERALKRRMFACFRSQQSIIKRFTVSHEKLRPAPAYNFSRAPHKGRLLYEQWWGVSGKAWRGHAKAALDTIK